MAFINSGSGPEILNAGELSDSLMGEALREPFSKFIMPLFGGMRHRVLFLTKGDYVKHILENDWQDNLILSWTLNAGPVSERWELGAPGPKQRLEALRRVWEAGYEVRIRIDPQVPIPGWEGEYKRLVDEVFSVVLPERITLGTLRGLGSTLASVKDESWTVYLHEQSGWGKKMSFQTRLTLYTSLIEYLRERHDFWKIGVCKETLALWRKLGELFDMDYRNITCNCVD